MPANVYGFRPITALALLLMSGVNFAQTPLLFLEPADDSPEFVLETMSHVRQQIESGKYVESSRNMLFLLNRREFQSLPDDIRQPAVHLANISRLLVGDDEVAHNAFLEATGLVSAGAEEWVGRLVAAMRLHDANDASISALEIMQRWPDVFRDLPLDFVDDLIAMAADEHPDAPAFMDIMGGISTYARNTIHFRSVSWDWYLLARSLVADGDIDGAAKAAENIVFTPHRISIRIDKRFDALLEAYPEVADVEAAMEFEIAQSYATYENSPLSRTALLRLVDALRRARRADEGLDLTDQVMRHINTPSEEGRYWTRNENLRWVLDSRSQLLFDLGRWDEAVAHLEEASELPEGNGRNVSQTINLALLYAKLGRTEDARSVLSGVRGSASDFGDSLTRLVELRVGLQEGDARLVQRSQRRILNSDGASSSAMQEALIATGQFEEAAELLIERLRGIGTRRLALLDVQSYAVPANPYPPSVRDRHAARRELVNRPDVLAAVAEIGRIEEFDVLVDDSP